MAPTDFDEPLMVLGLDSVSAVELHHSLQAKLSGVKIPETLIFDYPTINAVVDYFDRTVAGQSAGRAPPAANAAALTAGLYLAGLACRMPGPGGSARQYWDMLMAQANGISEIPFTRFDLDAHYDPIPSLGKLYIRHAGLLEQVDLFDGAFFGISNAEALMMDPQQRHVLEVAYWAMVDGGLDRKAVAGSRMGVFVGMSTNDFSMMSSNMEGAFLGTGMAYSICANRVSYVLGLKGPSLCCDTACSSSLVAAYIAQRSMQAGDCDRAVVAGVNLCLAARNFINFCAARMLSADGQCKTFDEAANGYVRGEGVGAVLLERSAPGDGLWEGHRVRLEGSAVNQDGRTASLTAPNGPSQTEVIAAALRCAGIAPPDVRYIECHGTGTALGDPIEVGAQKALLAEGRRQPLILGAVKTAIGHLEAAAGVASLVKAALALRHNTVPGNRNFVTLNPHMDLEGYPALFPTASLALPSDGHTVAGISSFGFGGTNAHLVLRQAGAPVRAADAPAAAQRRVAVVFTGQGAQCPNMGRNLFLSDPQYAAALQHCARILDPLLPRPLLSIMLPSLFPHGGGAPTDIHETRFAQPALFALEYAVTRSLGAQGLWPDAVLGHSLGEYVAACAAGVLGVEDALLLVAERARLMQEQPQGGAMVAVFAPETDVAAALTTAGPPAAKVAVAAVNGPKLTVLSGPEPAVAAVARLAGASHQRLEVSHAFHSPLMGGVARALRPVLHGLPLQAPRGVPKLISNVTGTWATNAVSSPEYWTQHLQRPVQFFKGLETVIQEVDVVVEVGPKPVLTNMAGHALSDAQKAGLTFVGCGDAQGQLDLAGLPALCAAVVDRDPGYRRQAVPYRKDPAHPLVQHVGYGAAGVPNCFEVRLGRRLQQLFADHAVLDDVVFPAAGYLELVSAAAQRRRGPRLTLEHVVFERPLVLDPDDFEAGRTLLVCEFDENEAFRVVSSKAKFAEWVPHVTGVLSPAVPKATEDWADIARRCPTEVDPARLYDALRAVGLQYGPQFQTVRRAWVGDGEAIGLLQVAGDAGEGYGVSPALIDGAMHLVSAPSVAAGKAGRLLVPVRVAQVVVHGPGANFLKAYVRLEGSGTTPDQVEATVMLLSMDDQVVMELRAVRFRPLKAMGPGGAHDNTTFEVRWTELSADTGGVGGTSSKQWLLMADEAEPLAARVAALFPGRCRIVPPSLPAPALDQGVHGVVLLNPLSAAAEELPTLEVVLRTAQAAVLQYTDRSVPMPRLLLATRCTQPAAGVAVRPPHAGLWGLARCARAEYPPLGWGCLDLGPEEEEDVETVARAIVSGMTLESCQGDFEPESAVRHGRHFVARLFPAEIAPQDGPLPVRGDATYVITGGLGGLGLVTAQWLAQQGAGHLLLVSRSGAVPDGLQAEWQKLAGSAGTTVHIVKCDVGDEAAVQTRLTEAAAGLPAVRGVIHAAGVLSDAAFLKQNLDRLRAAWQPKAAGAWHLHRWAEGKELDFFVLFSSIAGLVGSPGQANYGAANASLDAFAQWRQQQGLPALSIQWGAWADVGMAARQSKAVLGRLERVGLRPLPVPVGLNALGLLLRSSRAQVAVLRPNVPRLVQAVPTMLPHAVPLFRSYLTEVPRPKAPTVSSRVLAEVADLPREERARDVQQWVLASVRDATGITPEVNVSLIDQGMDSVALMEFRNLLQTRLGRAANLPLEAIAANPTVEAITNLILDAAPGSGPAPVAAAAAATAAPAEPAQQFPSLEAIPAAVCDFQYWPEYLFLQQALTRIESTGRNVYFRPHESLTRNTTLIDGQEVTTYSNYNYIGMAGHPEVVAAAKRAIDQYGTTVSASRVAGGEKPLHQDLERALAQLLGVEDTIVMLGGHATNVNTIGHLCGAEDLVLHDQLAHNSVVQGCLLSGSKRLAFPHNDYEQLDRMLTSLRLKYRRVLIVIEGVYSVDGDIPDVPAFIKVKDRHKALLMVDEAHSIGVLGRTGCGIREHFNLDPKSVDVWMGTLSKAFASAGGYVGGTKALVQYLKYTAPGFVFSVGLSPPNAAAALASIQVMLREPQRLATLKDRSNRFCALAKERGLDTGPSKDTPVVPVIVGPSMDCIRLSQDLLRLHRIHSHPMVYPAVAEDKARLRFFITSVHTEEQLVRTADAVAQELRRIRAEGAAATR
eukprot:EG_transcript_82